MYKQVWKNIALSVILFATLGMLSAQPASAMLIESCQYESFLFNQSNYVVEGQLEKVDVVNESGITTVLDFKISKYIKGSALPGDLLRLRIPGGKIGDKKLWVEDFDYYSNSDEGKSYKLYLADGGEGIYPVCAGFGIRIIELNTSEPAPVVPPHINDSIPPASNVSKPLKVGTPNPSGNPAYLFAAAAAVLVAAAAVAYFVLRGDRKKQG